MCRGRPAERAAIVRQIERFERELLAVEAKTALRRRDFQMAADRFKSLHQREGGAFLAAVAAASRYAPVPLFWFYRGREALRRIVGRHHSVSRSIDVPESGVGV